MRFGICAPVEMAGVLRDGGADFVEENVQNFLQGQVPDSQWTGGERAGESALPILVANCLLPGTLKIVGPDVDFAKIRAYIGTVMRRAAVVGMKILVFGSAGARNVPEGFDRGRAGEQILEFVRMAAEAAAANGIVLVAEPLSRDESNIIHTIAEAMELVRKINHPNFQCLLDSFHFWVNGDRLEDLAASVGQIRHVHVADREGRVASGESGKSDYRPLFRILKKGGYDGGISVESPGWNNYEAADAARVIQFLKNQWQEA
jgi:sugar phosphate isomerase/epimerase